MQFLQSGLDDDERCLFVSTEQTPEEIRFSFAPFGFEIDHENLIITSVHATPGRTLEEGEDETLTLSTLEGDELIGSGYSAPFREQYIERYLKEFGPVDRVVFDSISGLSVLSGDSDMFRRAVLDLVRLFSDEFNATSLFIAEGQDDTVHTGRREANALQFSTHGVVRLGRKFIDGDPHRFLRVVKMRGIDHDTREFEVEFTSGGVRVASTNQTQSAPFLDHEFLDTGIEGLNWICGGGLIRGETALLEHDGRADINVFVMNVIASTLRNDEAVVLLPSANLGPERLDGMLSQHIDDTQQLLEEDRLFILDLTGLWDGDRYNVFSPPRRSEGFLNSILHSITPIRERMVKRMFQRMDERRGDRSATTVVYTESMLPQFDPLEIRQLTYWGKETILGSDELVLFVHNPDTMDEKLAEFYVYDAGQMLRTWRDDVGLQYLKLEKAPTGSMGSAHLVENIGHPPYVQVQHPADSGHFGDNELPTNRPAEHVSHDDQPDIETLLGQVRSED